MMDFEWDDVKARANQKKHKVAFDRAMRVFLDPAIYDLEDDDIYDEDRLVAIGMVDHQLLVVIYTMRGTTCRIISARRAEPHEKIWYNEG